MAACHQLGFDVSRNSAIRSAKNPTLEPNMKCIGSPVVEIWPFSYLEGIWNPHIGGRGGRRGSAMAPFERTMVVSYRLSIVTVALSVTIRPQFAIECLWRSNQQGGGSLWTKISGCSLWSRPLMFGSAESEHLRLTNGEIISEEFQPMWSQSTNVTDRWTDGQTSCDRKTTLCTKVHRTVKNCLAIKCFHLFLAKCSQNWNGFFLQNRAQNVIEHWTTAAESNANFVIVYSWLWCQCSAGQDNWKAKYIYWHAVLVLFGCCLYD